jgi:hypothetical protein
LPEIFQIDVAGKRQCFDKTFEERPSILGNWGFYTGSFITASDSTNIRHSRIALSGRNQANIAKYKRGLAPPLCSYHPALSIGGD